MSGARCCRARGAASLARTQTLDLHSTTSVTQPAVRAPCRSVDCPPSRRAGCAGSEGGQSATGRTLLAGMMSITVGILKQPDGGYNAWSGLDLAADPCTSARCGSLMRGSPPRSCAARSVHHNLAATGCLQEVFLHVPSQGHAAAHISKSLMRRHLELGWKLSLSTGHQVTAASFQAPEGRGDALHGSSLPGRAHDLATPFEEQLSKVTSSGSPHAKTSVAVADPSLLLLGCALAT